MIYSKRTGFPEQTNISKGKGFRLGKVFGVCGQLALCIIRDLQNNFIATILPLLMDQEQDLKETSFMMYSKDLAIRDVPEVMETIYSLHYSKRTTSSIGRGFYS